MIDIVGIVASLAVALISVALSHCIAQRIKFRSNLRGLLAELDYNLKVLADIRAYLGLDEEAEKESKQALTTFPKLCRFAFDYFVIEGHLLKIPKQNREKLLDIYRGFDLVNKYIEHYNETKYGVLFVTSGATIFRKSIRKVLKKQISETERMIKDFLKSIN